MKTVCMFFTGDWMLRLTSNDMMLKSLKVSNWSSWSDGRQNSLPDQQDGEEIGKYNCSFNLLESMKSLALEARHICTVTDYF